jgi:DNA recombination protein RmuC
VTQGQFLILAGLFALVLLCAVGVGLVLLRRRPGEEIAQSLLGSLQGGLSEVGARVAQVAGELQGVARTQESVRTEVVQTREQAQAALQQTAEGLTARIHQTQQVLTAVTELVNRTVRSQELLSQHLTQVQESLAGNLTSTQEGLRAEIGKTRELLAQIQAADQARARQEQEAWGALKRVETVLAGSKSRGMAGENILASILAQLPAELRETNLVINNKPVEFALRLPQGRVLPIDSKWPALAVLEQLQESDDPVQRKALADQIQAEVKRKVREVTKYLDPERTIRLGVLAVPDAVFDLCVDAHVDAFKQGVVVISYTQAIPYLLSLLQVVLRFGTEVDAARLSQGLTTIADALEKMDQEVEGRLSRTITQLQNSRDDLKSHLGRARQGAAGLRVEAPRENLVAEPGDPRLP